tara:strand:+ start:92 stop:283 length:192 start_codon:yes stop_codon:yes gene_type:complete
MRYFICCHDEGETKPRVVADAETLESAAHLARIVLLGDPNPPELTVISKEDYNNKYKTDKDGI